ncbi:hypothetical protein D1007_20972 [Hordeum vulgare]|nr:hypothetical protein D1007_20972 [Hordeum vulgare]
MDGSMGVAMCVTWRAPAGRRVAGLDTLLPLHTAVASARLKSCIAVDSTCWCSLSQERKPGTVAFASSVQGLHFSTNQQPTTNEKASDLCYKTASSLSESGPAI